jgi:hypothetical protein
MTISRGQMYRQLYMGGGIGSLDAGAPSIKYEGDIRPQMTSAPDPMDALNDLAMQLFGKPLDMLTPSERQALDEYNSGMMAVGGRVNYGLGSKLKSFARKIIPNEISEIAVKAAPFVAPFNPLLAAGMAGIGGFDQTGRIGSSLKSGLLTYGGGQLARAVGGAGMQKGFNPFQGGNPFTFDNTGVMDRIKMLGSSPIKSAGTDSNIYQNVKNRLGELIRSSTKTTGTGENKKTGTGENKDTKGGILDLLFGKNNLFTTLLGGTAAKLSYDQQKALEERLRGEYEAYQSGASRFRERMGDKSKLRGYEVTGVPRTVKDVVRAPAMGGGIMDSRMMYASGSEDLEYKGWKRIYLKSNDAAESHPRHSEFIKRFAEETMGQDRSPEVRIKKAVGGDLSEPMSSFELQNLRAGPDWYIKRIEALMYEYDMDYDTAAEIAFDSDKYFELMPDGLAKGGRPGYAMGNTAQMAAGIEGLPLRNNQVGITELDLRDSGGFIPPVGIKEKADDIPAMLSNNEFVFTADAVRGMGDGDVDVGAQRMYDIMKKLEKGGRV